MKPTADRVRQLFTYDPTTGIFIWNIPVKRQRMKVGAKAGGKTSDGGWRLKIDGIEHPAAVIAFLYMTSRWPAGDIDHIDRDRSNNRWTNLREGTRSQNIANMGYFPHSAPYKGVSFDKQTGKWRARIRVRGTLIALGRHPTPELAHQAYLIAAREHFGEFARGS